MLIGDAVAPSDYENTARLADDLRLVDDTGAGVRFRNTLIQAYLGSNALRRSLDGLSPRSFLGSAGQPRGRELLMAIVFACTDRKLGVSARAGAHRWLLDRAAQEASDDARLGMLAAAAEIERELTDPKVAVAAAVCARWPADRRRDERHDDAKRRVLRRLGSLRTPAAMEALWQICESDADPATRFVAGHQIAAGGNDAFDALHPRLVDGGPVAACVAPLLAGRCRDFERAERLCDLTVDWARAASQDPLTIRRLAQGLRWQANRCDVDDRVRARLTDAGQALLDHAEWWNTLAVLQALTLWELSRTRRRTLAPGGTLDGWLAHNPAREHPYVRAERGMCCCALRSRQPGRSLWIDETLSLRRIGSGALRPASGLWLAPTGGWLSLDARGQQLLADVVLILNLAGFPGSDNTTHQPRSLRGGACAVVQASFPSDAPRPAGADGDVPLLGDISASFARSQQRIFRRRVPLRSRAPWQNGRRRDYLRAWQNAAKTAPE